MPDLPIVTGSCLDTYTFGKLPHEQGEMAWNGAFGDEFISMVYPKKRPLI